MMRALLRFVVLCFALAMWPVMAQTRAWLEPEQVVANGRTTLHIETTESAASPDLTVLRGDFDVGSLQTARQVSMDGGGVRFSTKFSIALRPKREGVIRIAPIRLGRVSTSPLQLLVGANAAVGAATPTMPTSAANRGPVFIETEVDDPSPYVQQSVGVTVRLFYAVNLYSGEFKQAEPVGGSLQQIGNDTQGSRDIGGRDYRYLERRFLLTPERSGELILPGAHFEGEGQAGFIDDLFGDGRQSVRADGQARRLQVRALPAAAPQPWLPARNVRLSLASPTQAPAGKATQVIVTLDAEGAVAAQLPDPELKVAGAQVFAEASQRSDRFENGRPVSQLTRRFSIVPQQPGKLVVSASPVAWWDVATDQARMAEAPPLMFEIAPGDDAFAQAPSNADASTASEESTRRVPWWMWLIAGIVACSAIALLMAMPRGRKPHDAKHESTEETASLATTEIAAPAKTTQPVALPPVDHAALRALIAGGDLQAIASALPRMSMPVARDLADLQSRLDDAAQIEAVSALQTARWGSGDPHRALALLAAAFTRPVQWKKPPKAGAILLPPHYPES